jgi:hypothetical protein
VNGNGIVVVIGKLASPWLTVGKANGEVPSNKVALAETVSIGRQLLANQQKVMFVCRSNVLIERFCGVQHGCTCQCKPLLIQDGREELS